MTSIRSVASALALAALLGPAAGHAQTSEELTQVFAASDSDADGALSAAELSLALEAPADSDRGRLLVVMLDADGSDDLSLAEFQDIGALMSGRMSDAQLDRLFAFLDGNDDAALNRAEFLEAVVLLGDFQDQATSEAQFHAADQNGDGSLDPQEFKALFR